MASTAVQETMTAKERTAAALQNERYDRIPVNLLIGDHAARVVGVTVGEYQHSATLMAQGQIEAYRRYGMDMVNVGPGLTGLPEALGSRVAFPDGSPYVAEPAVTGSADVRRLRIPDPHRDGRLPLFLEAATRILKEIGDEVPVSMTTSGPFTTAAHLRGTEQFLRDLHKDKPLVHELLRLASAAVVAFGSAAAGIGVRIGLADPTASGTLISRAQFREFALPYLREVVAALQEAAGAAPSLHICGNTAKLWEDMADTGAGVLSLDDCVDLREAKLRVGDRVALLGNVRPTASMFLGTPADVEEDAKACLRKAWDSPKGYILGLGCGLPIDTPPENILALVDAARRHGRYDLKPAPVATP